MSFITFSALLQQELEMSSNCRSSEAPLMLEYGLKMKVLLSLYGYINADTLQG